MNPFREIFIYFTLEFMKFYLSSYKLWNPENIEKLKEMLASTNKKVALISNAMDYDLEIKKEKVPENISDLKEVWLLPEIVDLKDYFGKRKELEIRLKDFDIIFVRGGNTFVLLQAMKLSWFDAILMNMYINNEDKIYIWYSAGVCVLWSTLEGIHLADDPDAKPYWDYEPIWEWLKILDYAIAPHYKSNHFETELIDRSVAYMVDHKILFKALRDGEVIVME